jgi:hypothetical protein
MKHQNDPAGREIAPVAITALLREGVGATTMRPDWLQCRCTRRHQPPSADRREN